VELIAIPRRQFFKDLDGTADSEHRVAQFLALAVKQFHAAASFC
jgi:hypothetical protein